MQHSVQVGTGEGTAGRGGEWWGPWHCCSVFRGSGENLEQFIPESLCS